MLFTVHKCKTWWNIIQDETLHKNNQAEKAVNITLASMVFKGLMLVLLL